MDLLNTLIDLCDAEQLKQAIMRQTTDYQLVSTINTSLDNLFMINVIEHYNNRLHSGSIMFRYADFEYNEQTN